MTDGDEFSSWFTHDGGPCPLSVGTVAIRKLQKSARGRKVQLTNPESTLLQEDEISCTILGKITPLSFSKPNTWEWQYYGVEGSSNLTTPKVLRYRVKKSPGVKLLEQIAKDPPRDLITDPERKLLEYHPT